MAPSRGTDGESFTQFPLYDSDFLRRFVERMLLVPKDRESTFSTAVFARYQRSEQALVTALMEMYLEGVSTRKVREITEALCGTSFSKSLVSSLTSKLDTELAAWRNRPSTRRRTLICLWMPAMRTSEVTAG